MDESVALVAILICILIAAAISKRIQGTIITLPMVYTVLGLILSGRALGVIELDLESELIRIIAEITLVLVLATDGFWEGCNSAGEQFGSDRLVESLRRVKNLPATEMIATVYRDLVTFLGHRQHDDDLTMVILRMR